MDQSDFYVIYWIAVQNVVVIFKWYMSTCIILYDYGLLKLEWDVFFKEVFVYKLEVVFSVFWGFPFYRVCCLILSYFSFAINL